tara:strand:+ start:509 stop:1423 length:915 start_codon:yes stop_codon:yes gene_type:complete
MKKTILISTILTIINVGISQDSLQNLDSFQIENKNGVPMLPVKGELSVGLSMGPILDYFGNFFNGSTSNSASALFLSYPVNNNNLYSSSTAPTSNQIFMKYFLSDKSAVRLSFEYTGLNNYEKAYVQNDVAVNIDSLSNSKSEDMIQTLGSTFILSLGYEKRRGSSRIQGYYGASTFFLRQNSQQLYSYSNPLSDINPSPSSMDWGDNLLANNSRKLSQNNGVVNGFGMGGILGVEYFIFPKASIGAEVGYNYIYLNERQSSYEYERWNVNQIDTKKEIDSPGLRNNEWGTFNPSANFFLMFHF